MSKRKKHSGNLKKDIMEVLYCNQIFLFQRIGLRQLIQGKMRWLINNTNVILEKWE